MFRNTTFPSQCEPYLLIANAKIAFCCLLWPVTMLYQRFWLYTLVMSAWTCNHIRMVLMCVQCCFPSDVIAKRLQGLTKLSAMADPARMKPPASTAPEPKPEESEENEVGNKGPTGSEASAESTSQQTVKDDEKSVSHPHH